MSNPKLSFWSESNIIICFVLSWQQKVGSDVNIIILFFLPPEEPDPTEYQYTAVYFSLEREQREMAMGN